MTFKYFNVKNGLTTGNIALHSSNGNVVANTFVGNLNVTGTANLGNVSNLVITGGAANYVLSTDGQGNLSWVAQSGGGGGGGNSISNGNTSVSIPTINGNILFRVDEATNVAVVSANGVAVTGNLSATGLLTAANASLGNTASANFLGGTLTTAAQPNITSLGTLSGLTVSGTSNLGPNGNIIITGGTVGQVLTTDGAGNLSWTNVDDGASISNGSSNVDVAPANGNVSISVGGNANVVVVTSTGMNVAGYSNTTGNIIGGGNLNIAENAVIGGNLTVSGNLVYVDITDLSIEDPIIQLQRGPNGAAPTSNTGKDVGTALNYYDGAAKTAFMGWNVSNAEIALAANVTIANDTITSYTFANIRAGNAIFSNTVTANFFIGSGANLSNIAGANVTGTVANATYAANAGNASVANTAGTVTTAAQPNITSVGTLTDLTVTGNITAGNANLGNAVSANFYIGNGSLLTGITAVSAASIANGNSNVTIPAANGNVTVSVAGNANVLTITGTGANVSGTLVATGNLSAANASLGNVASANFLTGTLTTAAQPNITSVGTLGSLAVTGNVTAGNANLGNAVTANFYIGDGSLLTGITAVSIANGNSNVSIPAANGNINFSAEGNANVFVLTGRGAVLTGNMQTGNGTGGNITGANVISAQTINASSALNVTGTSNLGPVGNVTITGGSSGQVLQTNGSGVLTWATVSISGLSNGTSNIAIPVVDGNVNISAAGNANVLVVTGTGANIAGTSNTTGNIVGGGNLNISGNAVIGGNLTVDGNLIYVNVTDLSVEDPIIQLQTGPNGAAPTSNSGKDVGTALNYYDSSAKIAWMGWDTSNAEIAFGANVGISSEVVTFTQLANIRAGNANLGNAVSANFYIGNGSLLTGITAVSAASIANGNSNVTIPAANGNVNISASGNANVLVVTGTGANIAGNLDVTGNITAANITTSGSAGNITGANVITACTFIGNTGNFSTALTVTGTSNLGPVGNVTITGGSNGQFLQTNGSGVLSWATISTASISNGNSNVNIPAANGNVNISAAGNANVVVVTGTGANIAGTLNVTGNANAGNIGATGGVFTTVAGSLTTAAQPNITSVGTLSSLTVTGNITSGNASLGNLVTANFFSGVLTTAAQPNITSIGTLGSLAVTGNITSGNANLGNAVTANFYVGNGSLLTGITVSSVSNGNSNVNIPAANGNVNISAAGNANILTVTGTGVNVAGTLNSTGNLTVGGKSNLGAVGNVIITGGTANYVLSTDGAGNLSWVAQSGGGGGGNGTPGGTNTQVQFNDANSFAGNAGFTFNKTTTTVTANNFVATSTANLGAVGNVTITGGSSGLVLTTNGSGGLSWGNVGTSVTVDDFMGSGSQTAFTLSTIPASVDYTLVSIAGTFQPRTAYSLAGNVLTFTSAPPAAAEIEVTTLAAATYAGPNTGTFINRTYTGDGANANFTVTNGVTANSVIVTENGIVQAPGTDYTISGANLTFTSAPANSVVIGIREIPAASSGGGSTWANASANVTASANTKYILNTASTAITVTLPAPSFGMEVGVIDGTGNANVNNITVFGNGANIQGSNANMTVNTSRAAFTLVYYNSAQGWLLTNV